MEVDVGIK